MLKLLKGRNPFALIILGALLIGAIGLVVTLMNAQKPSDARSEKVDSSARPSGATTPSN